MSRSLLLGALLVALVGCTETETRIVKVQPGGTGAESPDAKKVVRLDALEARVAKDPKDVQGWFELGEYHEAGLELIEAVNAYERGTALLQPGRYTGGHYLLARVYLRLQEWERSIANLTVIFSLEPKDPKSACLNAHFREAHYLRGAIHDIHKQYAPAKKEFLRFLEIGGEETRVEEFLMEIKAQGD